MASEPKDKSKHGPLAVGTGAALGRLASPGVLNLLGDPLELGSLGASLGGAATGATADQQREAIVGAQTGNAYGSLGGSILGGGAGYLTSKTVGPKLLKYLMKKYPREFKGVPRSAFKVMAPVAATLAGAMLGDRLGGAAGSAYGAVDGYNNPRRGSRLRKRVNTDTAQNLTAGGGGYLGYQLADLARVLGHQHMSPGVANYLLPAVGTTLGTAGAFSALHPDITGADRGDVAGASLLGGGIGGLGGLLASAPAAYLLNKYKLAPVTGRQVAQVLTPAAAGVGAILGGRAAMDSGKAYKALDTKEASVQTLLKNPAVRAALTGAAVGGAGGTAAHVLSDDPDSSLAQKALLGAALGAGAGVGGRALYNKLTAPKVIPVPSSRRLPAIYDVVNGKPKVASEIEQLQKTALAAGLLRGAMRGALPGMAVGAVGGAVSHATSDSPTSSLLGKMTAGALMGGAAGGLGGAAWRARLLPRAGRIANGPRAPVAPQKLLPAGDRVINLGPGEYKFSSHLAKVAAALFNAAKGPSMPPAPTATPTPVPASIGASPATALSKISPSAGVTPRR